MPNYQIDVSVKWSYHIYHDKERNVLSEYDEKNKERNLAV